jgi:hypothetical protein
MSGKRWVRISLILVVLMAIALPWGPDDSGVAAGGLTRSGTAPRVDYNREIRPLLSDKCFQCHGPDEGTRKARLRLDTREGALAKRGVIVPGDAAASRLLARITSQDPDQVMPPPSTGHRLTALQVELVRRWIEEGATMETHWAYVAPRRPAVPTVRRIGWARNPIDAFVLARLEAEGLAPSPEADRLTLLRRVSLDLTGLLPTPEEADAFLADRAPDAYERAVDRLLASPHFGERWARPWLDLARYADSHGYEKDRPRVMWKYRDWVVGAFNRDLPFDRFTIEQLAGDMLPEPTTDQLIATGFHRNTMLNQEGGVDDEEARWETLVDRTNTTATVWLGATLGCAQCHNHKYDPISQRDYYRMLAFFEGHDYSMLVMPGSEGWVIEPELELPTPEQAARRVTIEAELQAVEAALKVEYPALAAARAAWEEGLHRAPTDWQPLVPTSAKATGGTRLTVLPDHSLLASTPEGSAAPATEDYLTTVTLPATGGPWTALRVEVLPDASLPRGGPGRDIYGNFVLSGIEARVGHEAVGASKLSPLRFTLVQVDDAAGRLTLDWPYRWTIDATRDEIRQARQAVLVLEKPLSSKDAATGSLTISLKHSGRVVNQGLGRVRFSVTSSSEPVRIVGVPLRLREALQTVPAVRTAVQREQLEAQFRETTPLLKEERDRRRELRRSLDDLGIVKAPIMREKASFERPSTQLRLRGNYTSLGERVYAGTPAALHPWPEEAPINRLGLARWLVSPDNPLTARVTVNRFWEQLFGIGLVETVEDFGMQGSLPSHPELLDWLAVEFREGQSWSVKRLLRLIVTSASYRQASTYPTETSDPYNRLLARGARFRLDAETIRDTMLQASGLLHPELGGPSVFPLQPEGIWSNPYDGNSIKWTTSQGKDLHRRSLYTFLRRTAPYPIMTTFDAPSREFCTVRRVRTNTPLQALALLNDEASFGMARALARTVLAQAAPSLTEKLTVAFRRALIRPPAPAEVDRLQRLHADQLALFRGDPAAARQVAGDLPGPPAEAAALTMVANVLLNLDELQTRE